MRKKQSTLKKQIPVFSALLALSLAASSSSAIAAACGAV